MEFKEAYPNGKREDTDRGDRIHLREAVEFRKDNAMQCKNRTMAKSLCSFIAEELIDTWRVTSAQLFIKQLISFPGVTLELGQKPFDHHAHQTSTAQTGHVTEHMCTCQGKMGPP